MTQDPISGHEAGVPATPPEPPPEPPPAAPAAAKPLISRKALERAFSAQRLDAYRAPGDADELDGIARYFWNVALASALQPVLHAFEVTLRNSIYDASLKIVNTSALSMPDIPCWLDADPTLLYANERADVVRMKGYLSSDPKQRTAGHLIGKLGLGFWVQLTSRGYSVLRADGPRLWPQGLSLAFPIRFPNGSKPSHPEREFVYSRLDSIRQLRNRAAHHEPLWDRDVGAEHAKIVDTLGWMNAPMVRVVTAFDAFPAVLAGGHAPFRPCAELLLKGTPAPLP